MPQFLGGTAMPSHSNATRPPSSPSKRQKMDTSSSSGSVGAAEPNAEEAGNDGMTHVRWYDIYVERKHDFLHHLSLETQTDIDR